jgi:hypothetical protein
MVQGILAGQGPFHVVVTDPGFEPGKAEPTVLQTPGGYALTCANVKASSYLGMHWT